jgi:hypothetical protein
MKISKSFVNNLAVLFCFDFWFCPIVLTECNSNATDRANETHFQAAAAAPSSEVKAIK